MRIAKVYLLKWHDEGQLPYEPLGRQQPHADALVRGCEKWLYEHFRQAGVVARVVGHAQIPERTLKRRFKQAGRPGAHRLRAESSHRRSQAPARVVGPAS